MSSDQEKRSRGCASKVWYPDRQTAKRAARKLKRQGKMRPYVCIYCDGMHLTSKGRK